MRKSPFLEGKIVRWKVNMETFALAFFKEDFIFEERKKKRRN